MPTYTKWSYIRFKVLKVQGIFNICSLVQKLNCFFKWGLNLGSTKKGYKIGFLARKPEVPHLAFVLRRNTVQP